MPSWPGPLARDAMLRRMDFCETKISLYQRPIGLADAIVLAQVVVPKRLASHEMAVEDGETEGRRGIVNVLSDSRFAFVARNFCNSAKRFVCHDTSIHPKSPFALVSVTAPKVPRRSGTRVSPQSELATACDDLGIRQTRVFAVLLVVPSVPFPGQFQIYVPAVQISR